jgi:hypothetical protein
MYVVIIPLCKPRIILYPLQEGKTPLDYLSPGDHLEIEAVSQSGSVLCLSCMNCSCDHLCIRAIRYIGQFTKPALHHAPANAEMDMETLTAEIDNTLLIAGMRSVVPSSVNSLVDAMWWRVSRKRGPECCRLDQCGVARVNW